MRGSIYQKPTPPSPKMAIASSKEYTSPWRTRLWIFFLFIRIFVFSQGCIAAD